MENNLGNLVEQNSLNIEAEYLAQLMFQRTIDELIGKGDQSNILMNLKVNQFKEQLALILTIMTGSFERLLDLLLSKIQGELSVERCCCFRYDENQQKHYLIAQTSGHLLREFPGTAYEVGDLPTPEKINAWVFCPQQNIGFDAYYHFRAQTTIFCLAFDDVSQARYFKEEERKLLNWFGFLIQSSLILTRRLMENEERERKLEEAEKRSRLDPLLGIPNRRAWEDDMRQIKNGCYAGIIDLDYFKQVNDQLGHETGDAALKSFVQTLIKVCNAHEGIECQIYRYGGDEFGFIINAEDMSGEALEFFLQRKVMVEVEALKYLVQIDGKRRSMVFSCGFTKISGNTDTELNLGFKNIDAALYFVKLMLGRSKVFYSPQPKSITPDTIVGKTPEEVRESFFGFYQAELNKREKKKNKKQ